MVSSKQPPHSNATKSRSSETGATRAYAGYEYQLLVSVWVALVLFFEEECAGVLELEPASQEDIEASLDVPPERASSVVSMARRLIVQVKLHASAPWSVSEFEQVLKGKEESKAGRTSALSRLMDEQECQYVLVTDAQLPRTLQPFRVERLLDAPPDAMLSKKVRLSDGVDRAALSRRIGILDLQHPELVSARIHAILERNLSLPGTRVASCTQKLLDEARLRLLNREPRQWTRENILRVVESSGGNPSENSELRAFVPPGNYASIQRRLDVFHGVILQGPPGAGKTQVLEKLKHEYRTREDPFEVPSPLPRSSGELREALSRPGRLFIPLEDPWGKFQKEPGSDRWSSDLPSLLKLAGPDKKIVVTTREALLFQVGRDTPEAFRQRSVPLTYDDYDEDARRQILENKLVGALPWQRELAIGFVRPILKTLVAPLSIDRLVDKLKGLESDAGFDLETLLNECAVEHLALRFVEELKSFGPRGLILPAAIALWGLLSLSPESTFNEEESTEWVRLLRNHVREPIPWNNFLQWVVAGRWLTREAGRYRAHSTTLEGLEKLLHEEREYAEDTLQNLVARLVELRRTDEAYEMFRLVPEGIVKFPPEIQAAFRVHLRTQLATAAPERFQDLFDKFVELSDADEHPVSLLVEGMVGSSRRQTKRWFRVGSFIPPVWSPAQKAQVYASSEARAVLARFIEWLLPFQALDCDGSMASWLWSLDWDLTEDFRRSVHKGLEKRGAASGMGEAVHGALMAAEPQQEELLEALLEAWDAADAEDSEFHDAMRHKARQKMLSEWDADSWMEASHDIYVMSCALNAAVTELRHRQGYQWLVTNPRRPNLLSSWHGALAKQLSPVIDSERDEKVDEEWVTVGPILVEQDAVIRTRVQPVTAEELRSFYDCCMPDNAWALWNLVKHFYVPGLIPALLDTLVSGPPEHMDGCLSALCAQVTEENFGSQLSAALGRASVARRDAILFVSEAHDWAQVSQSDSAAMVNQAFEELTPPSLSAALTACRHAEAEENSGLLLRAVAALGLEDRQTLRRWSRDLEFRLGRAALVVLAMLGEDVTPEAQVVFQSAESPVRVMALRALMRIQGSSARACLLRALADEHYECRLLAIRGLIPRANESERRAVIALAQDGSAPVREACVQAIQQGRWPEGIPALCGLLSDARNGHYGEPDRNVNHHVARAAADALSTFHPLPRDICESLLDFLSGGITSNVDVRVHDRILQILAPMPLPTLPGRLVGLLKALAENPGQGHPSLRFMRRPPGVDPNVRYLRALVANGLAEHLRHQPPSREAVEVEPLLSMSSHPREALALSAWCCLAWLADRAWTACLPLLDAGGTYTEERAVLLLFVAARLGYAVRQTPLAKRMAEDSPVWPLVQWLAPRPAASLADWNRRWAECPSTLGWVRSLEPDDVWHKYLRRWLVREFGEPFFESVRDASS